MKLDWCDVGEVIGVAAQRVAGRLMLRPFEVVAPPDLPLVQMDFVLMEQVLVNLLDNACNYTPQCAPITVEAEITGRQLQIVVSDGGAGHPSRRSGAYF
ncbi:MAG: hypothetical protein IPK16_19125 [Anaerolineales bacterium]|nr:hypothetical protein [Anaerolineales bacterium]